MKLLKEEQLRAPVLSPGCNVHNAPPSGALTMRASLSRGVRGDIEGGLHHRVSSFPCRIYLCTKSVDVSRTANLDFLSRRFALTADESDNICSLYGRWSYGPISTYYRYFMTGPSNEQCRERNSLNMLEPASFETSGWLESDLFCAVAKAKHAGSLHSCRLTGDLLRSIPSLPTTRDR